MRLEHNLDVKEKGQHCCATWTAKNPTPTYCWVPASSSCLAWGQKATAKNESSSWNPNFAGIHHSTCPKQQTRIHWRKFCIGRKQQTSCDRYKICANGSWLVVWEMWNDESSELWTTRCAKVKVAADDIGKCQVTSTKRARPRKSGVCVTVCDRKTPEDLELWTLEHFDSNTSGDRVLGFLLLFKFRKR